MPLFKTILFAADFSEGSREAFRVACSLARGDGTRLLVLHVLDALQVAEEPVYLSQQTVHFSTVARDPGYHESIRERLRRFYFPDRPIETEYLTRDGFPTEEILRKAKESRCDLIVMGTHGRAGLLRLLMGSVAEAVLRRSTCPVLMVKPSAAITESTSESGLSKGQQDSPANATHGPGSTPRTATLRSREERR